MHNSKNTKLRIFKPSIKTYVSNVLVPMIEMIRGRLVHLLQLITVITINDIFLVLNKDIVKVLSSKGYLTF